MSNNLHHKRKFWIKIMFKNSIDIINFVDQLKNTEANALKFLFFITRSILVRHLIYRSKAITSTKIQSDRICYCLCKSHVKAIREKLLSIIKRDFIYCVCMWKGSRVFSVYNDHLPLESIFKRSLTKTPPISKIFTKAPKVQLSNELHTQ